MANWAIVIGVDQYWTPAACLRGAVRDALLMREWLVSPGGGAVPPRNVTLLLGPAPFGASVPAGIQYSEADQGNIIAAIERLVQKTCGAGERLFFHYSGHGLTARINFSDEQALLPVDFTDSLTTRSLGLRSILDYFEATEFKEQFFFIDGCRNIPWEGEFRIGEMPWAKRRDPNLPAIQQFVFYATSPGVKALEFQEAGNERGAFTEVLLAGLKGIGKAKAWDLESEEYVVRVDRLFDYLVAEFTRKRLTVGEGTTAGRLIQIPRLAGERGAVEGSNPILGRFAAGSFAEEGLNVFLRPSSVVPRARVSVERESQTVAKAEEIAKLPVSFTLPPKEYNVRVSALDHEPEKRRHYVELYEPRELTVTLVPRSPAPAAAEPVAVQAPPPLTRGLAEYSRRATLTVESPDTLAPLEIADSTGNILTVGQGRVSRDDLPPGFYRARLRTPEGEGVEELVELFAGDTEKVLLKAPEPPATKLVREVIRSADFRTHPDNTLEVSETSGISPLSSPQLSTILTLAGAVASFPENRFSARRLRSLGVRAFQATAAGREESGLQMLFGLEHGTDEEIRAALAGVRLRLWPFCEPVPSESFSLSEVLLESGLAQFTRAASPGPHWLSLEWPGQGPLVFALSMLPGRVTMLVLQLTDQAQMRIFLYLPRTAPAEDAEPRVARRLELLQRFYLSGRLDYAYESAKELLYGKWEEPISGILGGNLMLRLGRVTDSLFAMALDNMTRHFGELSDSHLLLAEREASRGNREGAAAAARSALDKGLPMLSDGLVRLFDAVRGYDVRHPRVDLLSAVFRRRVRGLLWTVWTPDEFQPGSVLAGDRQV